MAEKKQSEINKRVHGWEQSIQVQYKRTTIQFTV